MNRPSPDQSRPTCEPWTVEPQTLRVWLSDQQWMSLIWRIEQGRAIAPPPPSDAQLRREPRLTASFHCILRVTQAPGRSSTFTVRSCNLSRGGMGFVHDRPIAVGAVCTVALDRPDHGGRVIGATVAWCRPIPAMDNVYEVGLRFTEPIDVETVLHPSAA